MPYYSSRAALTNRLHCEHLFFLGLDDAQVCPEIHLRGPENCTLCAISQRMHDPFQGTGCLLPRQNGYSHSRPERRKQFAALPRKAPEALIRDTIYLYDPAEVWPHRALESRRIFQNLLRRYYRQIMYGCTNPNCKTPTCLSNLKRTSRTPFRRFTVLSARALATSLATRDTPELDLCPHQPVKLLEEPEVGIYRDEIRVRFPAANNTGGNVENKESSGAPNARKGKKISEQASKKDPKSFTQNLFDTEAMKMLQLTKVKESILQWAPWFKKEGDISQQELRPISRVTNTTSDGIEACHSLDARNHAERSTEQTRTLANGEPKLKGNSRSDTKPNMGWRLSQHIEDSGPSSESHSWGLEQTDDVASAQKTHGITNIDQLDNRPNQSSRGEKQTIVEKDNLETKVLEKDYDYRRTGGEAINFRRSIKASNPSTDPLIFDDGHVEQPQTLSRFTLESVVALVSTIKSVIPEPHDEYNFQQSFGRIPKHCRLASFLEGTSTEQEMTLAFGTQSIIYVLSTGHALLESFIHTAEADTAHSKKSVPFHEIVQAFRLLREIDYHPSNIISSLWISVGKLHPPTSVRSKSALIKACRSIRSGRSSHGFKLESQIADTDLIPNADAVHIAKITLAALVALIPECNPTDWSKVQKLRGEGRIIPERVLPEDDFTNITLEVFDSLHDDMALSLMRRLVRAITARQCLSEISNYQETNSGQDSATHEEDFMGILIRAITDMDTTQRMTTSSGVDASDSSEQEKGQKLYLSVLVEWLRSLILSEWEGQAEVARWGVVGGALELMSHISRIPSPHGLDPESFYTPFLSDRLDLMEMPIEWLSSQRDRNTVHLLSYPFLFMPSTLVFYFRSINHAAMFKAFENSLITSTMIERVTLVGPPAARGLLLGDKLKHATQSYFVLDIPREEVLTAALNQLWRREKRELTRPLKIRMGEDNGEIGMDSGGVQQEFFRIAMREAFRPGYSLFTTDEVTHMAWFQPCSLEPLYKFELLGILTSLAVYNGLTLPVTFPLALYRKLLDFPVTSLEHIEDGWPVLARGLRQLQDWTGDDVEDVFFLSYVFEVQAPGRTITVDLEKLDKDDDWDRAPTADKTPSTIRPELQKVSAPSTTNPSSNISTKVLTPTELPNTSPSPTTNPSSEPSPVTSTNRHQYISDYIHFLTHQSILPQYTAFARGFFTLLSPPAVQTLFTPALLKQLVEGTQTIDVTELEHTATYQNCSPEEEFVQWFWLVVREFDDSQVRQLLEFVTSSDRVPVNGVGSINFTIQKNGDEDLYLPASYTCFSRLLLPAYSSLEILRERLTLAIRLPGGFGLV